jgi:FkbM family methyltransferase
MNNKPLIVDVGARWSYNNSQMKRMNKKFVYFGFEPDKNECKILNFKFKKYTNIKFYPIALAGVNKKNNIFYETENPACSSLKKPVEFLSNHFKILSGIQLKKTVFIKTTNLKDFFFNKPQSHIAYIKLDTQGTELDILKGCMELLDNTLFIESEFQFNELYHNANLFGNADVYLRSRGFELWNIRSLCHYQINSELKSKAETRFQFNFDENYLLNKFNDSQLFWGDFIYLNTKLIRLKDFYLKNYEAIDELSVIFNLDGIKYFLRKNAELKKWI